MTRFDASCRPRGNTGRRQTTVFSQGERPLKPLLSAVPHSGSLRLAERFTTPGCQALLLGLAVLLAALFGIFTRPTGFLAAFWPANALLLGLMVRHPALARARGWIAATLGYLAADLITGGDPPITLWLTAANLVGVATGVLLFRRLSEEDRLLRRPLSVLYLFAICAATGVAAAIVGCGVGVVVLERSLATSFMLWLVTELVNSIVLLPVILTAPALATMHTATRQRLARLHAHPRIALPALALLASMIGSALLGGPGAIMLAVPALLWCALSYDLFSTTLITLGYCVWTLIATATGTPITHPAPDYIQEITSLRVGVALLALGPLTAASINTAREELLRSLDRAANHDFLTDTLARRAFMAAGATALARDSQMASAPQTPAPIQTTRPAVLVMDIDHFKIVNDLHGHATGDRVLVTFAATVRQLLRRADLFGRLGGEEFAVVFPQITARDAEAIAERLRAHVEATPVPVSDGQSVQITVSVGLAYANTSESPDLDTLLHAADQALYQSKRQGRNRVTSVETSEHTPNANTR